MLVLQVVHKDGFHIERDAMTLLGLVHPCLRVDDFTDQEIDMVSQALNVWAGASIAGVDDRTIRHVEAIRQRLVEERILAARFEAVMGIGSGGDPGGPDREHGSVCDFDDVAWQGVRSFGRNLGGHRSGQWLESSNDPIDHLLGSGGSVDGQFSRDRLLQACAKDRKQTTSMIDMTMTENDGVYRCKRDTCFGKLCDCAIPSIDKDSLLVIMEKMGRLGALRTGYWPCAGYLEHLLRK